jgi:hypothetical protein
MRVPYCSGMAFTIFSFDDDAREGPAVMITVGSMYHILCFDISALQWDSCDMIWIFLAPCVSGL